MGFDVLSYAIGLQAGKASGGSGGNEVKVVRKSYSSTSNTLTTFTIDHNMGVIPDLILLIPDVGTSREMANSVALIQGVSTAAKDVLPFSRNRIYIVVNTGKFMETNTSTAIESNTTYPLSNVNEKSATFNSYFQGYYFKKGYWHAYFFSGLV